MKEQHHLTLFAVGLLLASGARVSAAVHYVDAGGDNATPPYTNWTTAATNIQDAVDAAVTGDAIVVTNGSYGRLTVDKPLDIHSVNGPQLTIINGVGMFRCADLSQRVSLSGFTLAGGHVSDGSAGAGVRFGTLNNCLLVSNSVSFVWEGVSGANIACRGGGAYLCALNNCTLIGNSVTLSLVASGYGDYHHGDTISVYGGGADGCALNNCTLIGNSASAYIYDGLFYGPVNFASAYGGGASGCTLNNCTLTGNLISAYSYCYGAGCRDFCNTYLNTCSDDYSCQMVNCIVGCASHSSTMNHCCTTPPRYGIGNITSAPLFVDQAGGNLRLQSNSPCINAGNNSYLTNSSFTNCFDLDGNPRIAGGTVDIGAYEFQAPTSLISYAWLQQYGLPTDGSADFIDPDGDGMNNWQEWRCGTDPTNALSVLRMVAAAPTGTNVMVTWQSVAGINYFLERSASLAPPAFTPVAGFITGQAITTTFTDTNAAGSGPAFYRVGVGN